MFSRVAKSATAWWDKLPDFRFTHFGQGIVGSFDITSQRASVSHETLARHNGALTEQEVKLCGRRRSLLSTDENFWKTQSLLIRWINTQFTAPQVWSHLSDLARGKFYFQTWSSAIQQHSVFPRSKLKLYCYTNFFKRLNLNPKLGCRNLAGLKETVLWNWNCCSSLLQKQIVCVC